MGRQQPCLCLQAATVPGQGLPRPAPTCSTPHLPRVSQGWEHLCSSGLAPEEVPLVVPYQPSPKQVRAGAPRIWPNKPFSAPATAAGSTGTSERGEEIKGKNREKRGCKDLAEAPTSFGRQHAHRQQGHARILSCNPVLPFHCEV